MADGPPLHRVEVSFVGAAPARPVERASGVSDVQVHGSILRCLVYGSFQPFLEALRGHEVIGFSSTSVPAGGTPPAPLPPPAHA
ncbi:MAG TPA: hypothetical protein VKD66_21345 [Streptosporangiaceae bacterium]|nr:hypothetical protein [Streptosporangiaceae bacterium]